MLRCTASSERVVMQNKGNIRLWKLEELERHIYIGEYRQMHLDESLNVIQRNKLSVASQVGRYRLNRLISLKIYVVQNQELS